MFLLLCIFTKLESSSPVNVTPVVRCASSQIIKSKSSLNVIFQINDLKNTISISYDGLLPDLFGENQGVVVTGSLDSKSNFVANEVLAKHDENYMPPEVADMMGIKPQNIND